MGHWQVLTLCLHPLPHQHPFLRRSVKYPSLNSLSDWGWQEMSCCCGWAVCSVHPARCAHAKTKDAAGLFHCHFPPYSIETRSLTEGDANISSERLEPTCPHCLPPQHPVVESQATLSFHMGAGNSNMALHAYTNKHSLVYGGVSSALTLNFRSSGLHPQVLVL